MNKEFENKIKVFAIWKASKGFEAKKFVSYRIYEYLAPCYLFNKDNN